jgi:hypothetical protein
METNNIGRFRDSAQNLLLVHDILDYLRFLDIGTIEDFNRVDFLGFCIPTGVDFTKVTLSKLADHIEV